MSKPFLVAASLIVLLSALVFAGDEAKYYYAGNLRKMRAGRLGIGESKVGIPGVTAKENKFGQTPGAHYFSGHEYSGHFSPRNQPKSTGIAPSGYGIELPTQTFSVGGGTVMVPYTPLPDVGMRAGKTGGDSFYFPTKQRVRH